MNSLIAILFILLVAAGIVYWVSRGPGARS
jgi:hypothetical protein